MTVTLDRPARLLGKTTPRLSTAPLVVGEPGPCGCGCALTEATTLGFEAETFASEVLGMELLPWQRWWLIHALELDSEGQFRFRVILTLVSRQSGKTHLLKVVSLYMLYLGHAQLVLGAAQSLDIAREAWRTAVEMARSVPELADEIAKILQSTVEYSMILANGSRYRITAANDKAGRGLSVDLLILDELRTYKDTDAWAALSNTTMARSNSIIVGISNAGDNESVVLNGLRSSALDGNDPALALFEWSAPDGCALDDVDAWAQANPGLGRTVSEAKLRSALATSRPVDFRTENLCQRVDALDSAVDADGWRACAQQEADDGAAALQPYASQLVLAVDVSYDDHHVTVVGAALCEDGRYRVGVFGAWDNTALARPALREMFEKLHPRAVGWFPSGPTAVLGADLTAMHGELVGQKRFALESDVMLPEAPGVVKLAGDAASAACQTLSDLVDNRLLVHPNSALLNAHIFGSVRQHMGDGWRFARRGAGHNDAAYAAAGAVHLARLLPPFNDYDPLDSVF